ncbi:hypothetical protein NKR19_g9829 [Coniochaeta hoffmannii]|uniref:F-box domain-containing protein n=1 Tax=Coniochaeta hoffmannii TaxID=91930 RepID=A0AA38VGF7_9PEZI|nr:hypothetical protein NKR19_g9829 [Coniochaeta hoffmannii]
MTCTVVPTHKRSFGQSGLDADLELGGVAKEQKLVHLEDEARAASLDTLPTEILGHIASYLSTPELLSLRLANRTIEDQLFNDFAAYYFTKKQFMLTPESLQCLVDISLHPKLSTVLEHVIISLDKYRLDLTLNNFNGGDPATLHARAATYGQGAYDQAAFLSSGQDRQLLAQAFRNLPNLRTVGLRDYNSGMRQRDGEGAQWRAYGATTVLQNTGMSLLGFDGVFGPHVASRQYADTGLAMIFAARAFTVVLQALGESAATPKHVEILTRDRAHALPDHAFHLPPYLAPTVAPVLSRLESLLLTVNLRTIFVPATDSPGSVPGYALQNLLSLTPNLAHLRLNFTADQSTAANVYPFLDRLAGSGSQLLPRLSHLDFGMMTAVDRECLFRVVQRWSKTLKGLSFWKVSLSDSAGHQAEPHPQEKPNRWAQLLVRLRKAAPGLARMSVGCLTQQFGGHFLSVTLKVDGKGTPANRVYGPEDMRDLKVFRAMLERELQVSWLEDHEEDGEEHDSDSWESGDEEDDHEDEEEGG